MEVYIERDKKSKKVKAKTVAELLKKLKLNPGTVLVTRNDELLIEEEKLSEKDKIRVLPVISGG
jgi:sulfur carrier protein ThiS